MKKLILCASVAFAVCAVNAASFVWGFGYGDYEDINGGRDATKGVYIGGMAYLYLGTVNYSSTAFDFSNAKFITSGGFDASTYAYGNLSADALSTSDDVSSTAAGRAFTLILVDNTSKDLASYEGNFVIYHGTSTEGSTPGSDVTKYAQFWQIETAISSSSWKTMAVPEPTSGLLLLLGVAGLALKRKHA